MTSPNPPEPPEIPPSIPDLVKKCRDLCDNVGSSSREYPAEKESFLRGSLGDALQQLELILRVLDGESRTAGREESQGFLRRIFARRGENPTPGASPVGSSGGNSGGNLGEQRPIGLPQQGLQGNSWTVSLSELLGFLAFGRKTGVLWVDTLEENYMLVLEEGRLLHATSDQTPSGLRLGEILVGFGFLTRRQLTRFLSLRKASQKVIAGEDLIESGVISAEELMSALTYQVQQLFFRLINTKNAVFRFRESMEIMLAHRVSLDINQLLLQTAAAQDESERVDRAATLDEWDSWDGPAPQASPAPPAANAAADAAATAAAPDPDSKDAPAPGAAVAAGADASGEKPSAGQASGSASKPGSGTGPKRRGRRKKKA